VYAAGRAIVSAALLVMSRAPVRAAAAEAVLDVRESRRLAGCLLPGWLVAAGGWPWLPPTTVLDLAYYESTRPSRYCTRFLPGFCAGAPVNLNLRFICSCSSLRSPGPPGLISQWGAHFQQGLLLTTSKFTHLKVCHKAA
jgi:hypothetical protein